MIQELFRQLVQTCSFHTHRQKPGQWKHNIHQTIEKIWKQVSYHQQQYAI